MEYRERPSDHAELRAAILRLDPCVVLSEAHWDAAGDCSYDFIGWRHNIVRGVCMRCGGFAVSDADVIAGKEEK